MTEHRRFLMDHGVPAAQIHRINLSSVAMPDDAVKVIESKMKTFPQDKEFIFIGHSKGALESLYYLKMNYRKIKLKNALLIQGPLDGASITKLPDEDGFLGFLNNFVKKFVSTAFVKAYDKSYSSTHVREQLSGLEKEKNLLEKIIFIESAAPYDRLKWRFKPLGGQYREYFGGSGDGVLMDTDHIPFSLRESEKICRIKLEIDHSDLVKAAPWNSLRVDRIKKFMERVFY